MVRTNIEREEFFKTAVESARLKGEFLKSSDITDDVAFGEFIRKYDWVIALWPDPQHASGMGCLEIRNSGKEDGYALCNSIPCADHATALKLHALARRLDNPAP